MSHADNGWRNLLTGTCWCCCGPPPGWPPGLCCRPPPGWTTALVSPNISCSCFAVRSFVPLNTKLLLIPSFPPPISCTATIFPNVMIPMRAFGGRRLKLSWSDSFNATNSSSSRQVSTTYRNTGGGTWTLVIVYSIVENWGISSAGWHCSVIWLYCGGKGFLWKQKLHTQNFAL